MSDVTISDEAFTRLHDELRRMRGIFGMVVHLTDDDCGGPYIPSDTHQFFYDLRRRVVELIDLIGPE